MHLIIGKEEEEVKRILADLLQRLEAPVLHLYPENFTVSFFRQEVETAPFLSKKRGVVIHSVDQLSEANQEEICRYLEKPSDWITLFLIAESLPVQSKISKVVEKQGKIVRIKEEKPWEKEKRLSAWLIEEAKKEGIRLEPKAAAFLVQSTDASCLTAELNKLICFVGGKKEILLEDISLISSPSIHHETLWQLGDAIFAGEIAKAISIGSSLLQEGMALIPLLANLRAQHVTGKGILEAAEQGEVAQKYPYLKGQLLDKKLKILKKNGINRINKATLLIFEAEIKAKNSHMDPQLLLEILLVKLNDDALFTP